MSPRVAEGLRRAGVDVVSAHEVGRANRRIPDEEQLDYATQQGRVLVTYNRADYQALDALWRRADRQHAGILWCREASIPRRAIGDLVCALVDAGDEFDDLVGLCLPLQRRGPCSC